MYWNDAVEVDGRWDDAWRTWDQRVSATRHVVMICARRAKVSVEFRTNDVPCVTAGVNVIATSVKPITTSVAPVTVAFAPPPNSPWPPSSSSRLPFNPHPKRAMQSESGSSIPSFIKAAIAYARTGRSFAPDRRRSSPAGQLPRAATPGPATRLERNQEADTAAPLRAHIIHSAGHALTMTSRSLA